MSRSERKLVLQCSRLSRPLAVVALAAALSCSDEGTGPPEVVAVLTGQAHAVDGGDLTGLWAVWRPHDGSLPDSSQVQSDGRITIDVTTPALTGDLELRGLSNEYHPFLFPFDTEEVDGLDLVVVPRLWTVRRGRYQGQIVSTSLDPVVDDNTDQTFFSYFQGQAFPRQEPELYLLELMTWPEDRLPAMVAFDHQNATGGITPSDSAAIWGVLDGMEEVFGLDLFQPVVADPTWWPEPTGPLDPDRIEGVIRLIADPPNWRGPPKSGEAPLTWERDFGDWAAGSRFDRFRVTRLYLDAGTVVIGALEPLQLADGLIPWETVLIHETMHVLGVGHTCRIESPMGPCARTAEPSPFDVAYMELLRETMRLQTELGTHLGMLPAIVGERRLLLGKSALPAVDGSF